MTWRGTVEVFLWRKHFVIRIFKWAVSSTVPLFWDLDPSFKG